MGPTRTTVWTSLRYDAPSGPFALVIAVPAGAALDTSSDAWFEALEVATAPRVFPPDALDPFCPGEAGPAHPFHVAGDTEHEASTVPVEVVVLDDATAVTAWAADHGLFVAPAVGAALTAQASHYLVARFVAPGGPAVTPTFRIAAPGGPAALPLVLTAAGSSDLPVTAWFVGAAAAALGGAQPTTVAADSLAWSAADGTSNWAEARADALKSKGPLATMVEARGDQALAHDVAIAEGTATIDSVVDTYFERAAAYGSLPVDPAQCSLVAASALVSAAVVAPSCARADLGVVAGVDNCVETVVSGQTDPAKLRCSDAADDLAVALSGLTPEGATLTRIALRIPQGQLGKDWPVSFGAAPAVSPVRVAGSLDLGGCGGDKPDGGTSSSSSGSGGPIFDDGTGRPSGGGSTSRPTPAGVQVDVWVDTGCSCDGTVGGEGSDTVDPEPSEDGAGGAGGDAYVVGSSEETTTDDCSGDTTESSSSGDDCSGDTTDTGASDSGDSCDSGSDSSSSGDSCSSSDSSSGDSCDSGSSGGDSCSSSDGSSDCSVGHRSSARARRPRMSAMTFGLLLVLAPLRRLSRRPRRARP